MFCRGCVAMPRKTCAAQPLSKACLLQVCLAAESCGHLGFDARVDKWWSSEIFHCGSGPRRTDVHFHDIFLKVRRGAGHGCMCGVGWAVGRTRQPSTFQAYASPCHARTGTRHAGAADSDAAGCVDGEIAPYASPLTPMMAHRAQVLPAAMLWGAGTAVGEIPPYAFSYHAAKAGMRTRSGTACSRCGRRRRGRACWRRAQPHEVLDAGLHPAVRPGIRT